MEYFSAIQKDIIRNLFKRRIIGGKHTELRNAIKGLPPEKLKQAKKDVKQLITIGYLLSKPSTGELHVSINPKMLGEIYRILED